jgi:hypothetical protein
MNAIPVDVRRVGTTDESVAGRSDLEADLARARILANWLDARFSFMGIPFGLDAIVGLIPVVGDSLTALASTYPIWIAEKHGLGKAVQARMALNVLIDWLPGLVPVLGDVFDVAYKANLKNVKLLEAAVERMRRRSS